MTKSFVMLLLTLLCLRDVQGQVVFGKNNRNRPETQLNYANPKEYEIAGIEVVGVEFLDNNALISMTGLRVGDKIRVPGEDITTALRKLWKQGILGDVAIYASKIEGDKIWLVIELKERPRLSRFNFEGVSKSMAADLKEEVKASIGKVWTEASQKNVEIAVKRSLETKGFLNADVKLIQRTDSVLRNSVVVLVDIEKNKKVKVNAINFYGNDQFSGRRLKKKLRSTGERVRFDLPSDLLEKSIYALSHPLSIWQFLTNKDTSENSLQDYIATHAKLNFFKSSKFVREDYLTDKEGLIAFYNSKGYRDAEVVVDSTYLVDERNMNIDIRLAPGNKYYFREITWSGNFVYTDEQLDQVLGIDKGDVYDQELINKKLTFNPTGDIDISALYMDDGYLFFNIQPIEVKVEGDSIDMEMRIQEGPQATINKVYVTGNDKTNDHVIMRELYTLPGEKFSRALILRTQNELRQLGYFDPEQINPIPKPNLETETVDIEWQLVEQPNDQIQLSGGWGGQFGFVGTVGLTFNNFSMRNISKPSKWRGLPVGDGQQLSLSIQANGRRFQSYRLGFTEPWLGGRRRNAFSVNLNQSVQRSIDPFSREVFGTLKVSGITVSLARRVRWPDDFFTVSNGISYLRYGLNNFGSRSLGFDTGDANSITFNTSISRSSIDNPMYPRTGSQINLIMAFTPPYSLVNNIDYENADNETLYKWLEYHKWNFDSKFYLRLVGDLVLASRAHFGYLGSYNPDVGVGPFERFQLGGDGLTGQSFLLGTDVIGLRGYENNSISPLDDNDTPNDFSDDIAGGTLFNKFVVELRYAISTSPTATIYGLTFFESGNNWNDFKNFNPYNQFRSAGVGIRIFMPAFGLMGLDWGYGFDTLPGSLDPSGPQFHFSIGQQIR